jgi:hypothetical protein
MRSPKTFRLTIIGASCVGIIAALLFAFRAFNADPFARKKFDQAEWKRWSVVARGVPANNPRGLMARDLVVNHLRVGMTRAEVLSLIGPPDETRVETNQTSYHLGGHSASWGYDFLKVSFGASNTLEAAVIVKDN